MTSSKFPASLTENIATLKKIVSFFLESKIRYVCHDVVLEEEPNSQMYIKIHSLMSLKEHNTSGSNSLNRRKQVLLIFISCMVVKLNLKFLLVFNCFICLCFILHFFHLCLQFGLRPSTKKPTAFRLRCVFLVGATLSELY